RAGGGRDRARADVGARREAFRASGVRNRGDGRIGRAPGDRSRQVLRRGVRIHTGRGELLRGALGDARAGGRHVDGDERRGRDRQRRRGGERGGGGRETVLADLGGPREA